MYRKFALGKSAQAHQGVHAYTHDEGGAAAAGGSDPLLRLILKDCEGKMTFLLLHGSWATQCGPTDQQGAGAPPCPCPACLPQRALFWHRLRAGGALLRGCTRANSIHTV